MRIREWLIMNTAETAGKLTLLTMKRVDISGSDEQLCLMTKLGTRISQHLAVLWLSG